MNESDIQLCSCMGPIGNDPFCPCVMRQRGLSPTDMWTEERVAELENVLKRVFGVTEDIEK